MSSCADRKVSSGVDWYEGEDTNTVIITPKPGQRVIVLPAHSVTGQRTHHAEHSIVMDGAVKMIPVD